MTDHATPQEQQLIFVSMAEKFVEFVDPEDHEVSFHELLEEWAHMLPTGGREEMAHHFMTAAAAMASLVLLGTVDGETPPREVMQSYREMVLSNDLGFVGLVQDIYGMPEYNGEFDEDGE